jgi:phage shock protein A
MDREPLSQHPHGVEIEELEELADAHREDLSNLIDQQLLAEVHLDRCAEKVEKVRSQLESLVRTIANLRAS